MSMDPRNNLNVKATEQRLMHEIIDFLNHSERSDKYYYYI